MKIQIADANPEKPVFFDQGQHLLVRGGDSGRQSRELVEKGAAVGEVSSGQFTDDGGMAQDVLATKPLSQGLVC